MKGKHGFLETPGASLSIVQNCPVQHPCTQSEALMILFYSF